MLAAALSTPALLRQELLVRSQDSDEILDFNFGNTRRRILSDTSMTGVDSLSFYFKFLPNPFEVTNYLQIDAERYPKPFKYKLNEPAQAEFKAFEKKSKSQRHAPAFYMKTQTDANTTSHLYSQTSQQF